MYYGWKPYVSVAQRRAKAEREVNKLKQRGQKIEPVTIDGRKIANTFWGIAWCEHLEKFSDYENRLPRGRTYVRNGSVCHLGIAAGKIEAVVSGASLYRIMIEIDPLKPDDWKRLREQCTGKIGSALELLQGKLSAQVMATVTDREHGLFPKPKEIRMHCNCPDWAGLCKHLAAVLYGIGARLDQNPEMLFQLRGVDPNELIVANLNLTRIGEGSGKHQRLTASNLSELFGVEIAGQPPPKIIPAPSAVAKQSVQQSTISKQPKKTMFRNIDISSFKPRERTNPLPTKFAQLRFHSELVPSGQFINDLRNYFKLSKQDFALLLEVTTATVTNWEKQPGPLTLKKRPLASLRRVAAMSRRQVAILLNKRGSAS